MAFNIWNFLGVNKLVEKATDLAQDAGAAAGKQVIKDIRVQGTPEIVISGAAIKIRSVGTVNIVDMSRNKVLIPVEIPLNIDIQIPEIKVPLKVDGKLYNE